MELEKSKLLFEMLPWAVFRVLKIFWRRRACGEQRRAAADPRRAPPAHAAEPVWRAVEAPWPPPLSMAAERPSRWRTWAAAVASSDCSYAARASTPGRRGVWARASHTRPCSPANTWARRSSIAWSDSRTDPATERPDRRFCCCLRISLIDWRPMRLPSPLWASECALSAGQSRRRAPLVSRVTAAHYRTPPTAWLSLADWTCPWLGRRSPVGRLGCWRSRILQLLVILLLHGWCCWCCCWWATWLSDLRQYFFLIYIRLRVLETKYLSMKIENDLSQLKIKYIFIEIFSLYGKSCRMLSLPSKFSVHIPQILLLVNPNPIKKFILF